MGSHLFAAKAQPATLIVDDTFDPPKVWQNPPRALARCGNCNRRRWLAHMVAQAYYDGVRFWCADGHGCRKPRRKPR